MLMKTDSYRRFLKSDLSRIPCTCHEEDNQSTPCSCPDYKVDKLVLSKALPAINLPSGIPSIARVTLKPQKINVIHSVVFQTFSEVTKSRNVTRQILIL